MTISQLIKKLQEEKRKYGDITVVVHAPNHPAIAVDVATFYSNGGIPKAVWISSEEAQ